MSHAANEQSPQVPAGTGEQIHVIGPDGQPIAMPAHGDGSTDGEDGSDDGGERNVAELVEQPAKVMRIGRMVQQLLEEVKAAPVDDAGRTRLARILHSSIAELKEGLAPELDEELDRLIHPFDETTPSESELRIAQAQLVGWLEGLFHGIQTAIYAQQMAARSQLEQIRRALPAGMLHGEEGVPAPESDEDQQPGSQGGMYL